eukprot:3574931-Pyramimonas_sp.AAC.1
MPMAGVGRRRSSVSSSSFVVVKVKVKDGAFKAKGVPRTKHGQGQTGPTFPREAEPPASTRGLQGHRAPPETRPPERGRL